MKTAIIDLHVHLDGSIPLRTADEILKRLDIPMGEAELRHKMQAPQDCRDLNEYLSVFDLPLRLMQSKEGIGAVTKAFHEELERQGLYYAEPRFALSSLRREGLRPEEVLEAVLRGREDFYHEHPNTKLHTGFLICAMRGEGKEAEREALESFEIAAAYLGKGVLGVDLAGAEALFPTRNFRGIFQRARELSLPYTIHAGEAAGAESVREALDFMPWRIGHGVRAYGDRALMEMLAKKKILLELCPSSNIQTRIFKSIEDFPIRELLEAGLKLSINTDNMTVSNTTLEREFSLIRKLGIPAETERSLVENAIDGIFSGKEEKERLQKLLKSPSC